MRLSRADSGYLEAPPAVCVCVCECHRECVIRRRQSVTEETPWGLLQADFKRSDADSQCVATFKHTRLHRTLVYSHPTLIYELSHVHNLSQCQSTLVLSLTSKEVRYQAHFKLLKTLLFSVPSAQTLH